MLTLHKGNSHVLAINMLNFDPIIYSRLLYDKFVVAIFMAIKSIFIAILFFIVNKPLAHQPFFKEFM